jgi:hypothetical protein
MKGIPREFQLDYHLEMMMRSQRDLKKEELIDSTIVKMKVVQREMHLNYHLEMMMGSQLDLKKEELMDTTMV